MPVSQTLSILEAVSSWNLSDKLVLANCVLTGLFLFATVISVVCAFKAYHHQKDRSRKEAACDLAKYYAEDIIQRYGFVTDVLEEAKLASRTKELFPYDELIEFNRDEALSFLHRQEVSYEEAKDSFMKPDPKSILKVMLLHTHSSQAREDLIQVYVGLLRGEEEKKKLDGFLLQHEFFNKVSDHLNAIEWFSMTCRYGIADEELLYQSLHQSFLSSVWQLYFYICENNITNEDKYYTNIIWLFSKWRGRMKEIQKEATDLRIGAQKRIDKAERQKIAAEDELKEAKPKVHSGTPLK